MSDAPFGGGLFHNRLRASAGRFLWLGLAISAVGIAALVFPVVSSVVATVLVGWVLLTMGMLTLAASFFIPGTGPFFGALLLGLLSLAAGVFLVFSPHAGEIALTFLVGVVFVFQSAFELFFALEARPYRGWAAMAASAISSCRAGSRQSTSLADRHAVNGYL